MRVTNLFFENQEDSVGNNSGYSIICKVLLAEFVATTLLSFFGCMSTMPLIGDVLLPLTSALGPGLVVIILLQSFGHISGAHMNPAVTLAALIMGKFTILRTAAYIVVQVIGAILGYGLLMGLTADDLLADKVCLPFPQKGYNYYHTIGIEAFMAAALIFICCSLWDPVNKELLETASIKFGLTVVGLILVGGPLTGASLNPAKALAPAIWIGEFEGIWSYCLGSTVGAAIAALMYRFLWLEKTYTEKTL